MTAKSKPNGWVSRIILLLSLALWTHTAEVQGQSSQNIVQNGSFETFSGRLPPPSWTGNFGLGLGFDGAADGRNFADLSQTSYFANQTLATTAGQEYLVTFAVSGNSSLPGLSIMQFSWEGSVVGNKTWTSPNTTGNGLNFDWVYGSFDVVAASSSTLISFQRSLASTSAGTWLDDVRVVSTPEPSAYYLLLIGTLLLVSRLRHRSTLPKTPEPNAVGHHQFTLEPAGSPCQARHVQRGFRLALSKEGRL
jgi:hypothetical protein